MPESGSSFWTLAFVAIGAAVIGGLIVAFVLNKRPVVTPPHPQAFTVSGGFALPAAPIMTNKEEIVWTDRKGRERKITIHREVH